MNISAAASTVSQNISSSATSQSAKKPDGDGDKGVETKSSGSTTSASQASPLTTLAQGKPLYG